MKKLDTSKSKEITKRSFRFENLDASLRNQIKLSECGRRNKRDERKICEINSFKKERSDVSISGN